MPLAALAILEGEPLQGYQAVLSEITSSLNSNSIVGVLSYAASIAVVMVLLWWSVRKSVSIIKRAFMRGKLKL